MIEGDNLEVLKLLQKSYHGKVKLIYIDPPYNTGNDFIYPDDYSESLHTYLEYTGQVDDEGKRFSTNTDTDGRFHSKWLSMMYPRLFLARSLLRDDGLLVTSIDDHEAENLKRICSEIYGEENFIAQITVQSNPRGRQSDTFVANVHEYLLVYARNKEQCRIGGMPLTDQQRAEFNLQDEIGRSYRLLGLRQRGSASRREDRPDMFYPIYVNPETAAISLERHGKFNIEVLPRKSTGEDGRWMWGKAKVETDSQLVVAKLIERRGEYDIFVRDYLDKPDGERTRKFKSLWDDKSLNTQNGTQEVKELIGSDAMPFPKPLGLLTNIVTFGMDRDGIVLDFFAGSGTTAHAVLALNAADGGSRRFILVQLPEPTGRDDFRTVADITKARISRVIANLNEENSGTLDLGSGSELEKGFRVFKLDSSNIRAWDPEPDNLDGSLLASLNHLKEDRTEEDILYELLVKLGLDLTIAIEHRILAKKTIYSVGAGTLIACLAESIDLTEIEELTVGIAAWRDELDPAADTVVVFRDSAFADDVAKTNITAILEQHGMPTVQSL